MGSYTRTRLAVLQSAMNDNRRPTMADALADIGRTPTQDWLLDIDFVALKAKWAAEDDVFTDDYGRSL